MSAGQSLGSGALGQALLPLETDKWPNALGLLRRATADGLSTTARASLFYGAPALAFALAHTRHPGLGHAREISADATATLTRRRLDAAHRRIDQRQHPHYAEYDLIRGLTGLGVVLRRLGNDELLRQVLDYLVRLTEPLTDAPGWWCRNEPQPTHPPRGGHANHGMAHGITGPLALLSIAFLDRITVDGQVGAIHRICHWLDRWEQHAHGLTWWPQTISPAELHRGEPDRGPAPRPSWCYGTPGITRAQQLAALATGNQQRRRAAETALARCAADNDQRALLIDAGLCHGAAGLYLTVWRAAADAGTPELNTQLPPLASLLASLPPIGHTGFLTGNAGRRLAARVADGSPPLTGWDACLLLH